MKNKLNLVKRTNPGKILSKSNPLTKKIIIIPLLEKRTENQKFNDMLANDGAGTRTHTSWNFHWYPQYLKTYVPLNLSLIWFHSTDMHSAFFLCQELSSVSLCTHRAYHLAGKLHQTILYKMNYIWNECYKKVKGKEIFWKCQLFTCCSNEIFLIEVTKTHLFPHFI